MRTFLMAPALVILAGCGGAEKTVVETADGKVTTSGEGSYTITTKDGGTARIESGAAAADIASVASSLPAYAQPYPGSSLVSNIAMDDGKGGKGRVVVLETSATLPEVTAFYDKAIAEAGVAKQMTLDQPGSAMRGIGTGGESGTLIAISDNGDSRTITLTTSRQPEAAKAAPSAPLQ